MTTRRDEIPNSKLTKAQVPPARSSWRRIVPFALSFNGYKAISGDGCGKLANSVHQEFVGDAASLKKYGLTELRACLFFEQRRFHHFGYGPRPDDIVYIRALVDAIRKRVAR
jgi:hypothetical protein